jgi:hypothetical protein
MLSVAAARCRRINRSIELIVQPAAKDPVGEMAVGGEPSSHGAVGAVPHRHRAGTTRRAACGVKVAEWFKAPVLKFAFPCFVQSSPIPHDVSLSAMEGLLIFAGVGLVRVVLECWRSFWRSSFAKRPPSPAGLKDRYRWLPSGEFTLPLQQCRGFAANGYRACRSDEPSQRTGGNAVIAPLSPCGAFSSHFGGR